MNREAELGFVNCRNLLEGEKFTLEIYLFSIVSDSN
jgi:hypothetical protein